MSAVKRDDLFTLIHKALRAGFLMLGIDAGRLDWRDDAQVQAFTRRWEQVTTLIRSHASHEERHVWPLLEAKQPGAVAELGVGHDPIDADFDAADALLKSVVADHTPDAGLTFYRALNRLVAHTLDHFSNEEPAVMDVLWAMCTDEELAAVRAALMSEIPRHEAAWTFTLMAQSCTADELRPVVRGVRDGMPEPAFAEWLAAVDEALPADASAQLHRLVGEPVAAG